MHTWQLQEAKAKLSEVIKQSKQEPQFISKHGVRESVVISIEHYKSLLGTHETLVSFLRNSPLHGVNITFKRDQSKSRDIDL